MQSKNFLILAAGFGTRMGEIGKIIPKPLFPFFEKNLLHLQIQFALSKGATKIFINAHHLSSQIKNEIMSNYDGLDIHVIEEEHILDVGGGIHGAARKLNYEGKLFVLNSDVLYLFSDEVNPFFRDENFSGVHLLALKVPLNSHYNKIEFTKGLLKKVESKKEKSLSCFTYSGLCKINLHELIPVEGKSSFFSSVANYQEKDVFVDIIEGDSEYWDFGTIEQYFENIKKIYSSFKESNQHQCLMMNFLDRFKIIHPQKILHDEYVASCFRCKKLKMNDHLQISLDGSPIDSTIEKSFIQMNSLRVYF